MRIIGCDLRAQQQTISMVDIETGEVTEKTLAHEGEEVREFYAALLQPVLVGLTHYPKNVVFDARVHPLIGCETMCQKLFAADNVAGRIR